MLKFLYMDEMESKKLSKKMGSQIKLKMCYKNIFDVVTAYPTKFNEAEWFVGMCYIHLMKNLYARHCVIVTKQNEVIDPTYFLKEVIVDPSKVKYICFDAMTMNEFLDRINKNNYCPDLISYYGCKEKRFINLQYEEDNLILIQ